MSKLAQALADQRFVVTVELDPPRGTDLGPMLELARALAPRVQAFVISDNRGAVPRMNPLLAACRLVDQAGAEVVLTLACRDRNRLALTSDMLAAAAAGVTGLLLVSGTYVSLGDHPGGKPVHDLDSVQALQLATQLTQGSDLSGTGLDGVPTFFLGASAHPQANPLPPQVMKLRKKVLAGAAFLISEPLASSQALISLREHAGDLGVPLLAGVELSDPAGREQAVDLVREIKSGGLAAGVHLSAPNSRDLLPDLLEACGL